MFDHFLFNAFLGGIGLALLAAPLGCFVVWRRMAFFGDTISHSALLGVALGIFLKIDPFMTILFISMIIAVFLLWSEKFKTLETDTYLSIASHSTLSLGLILIYILEPGQLSLVNFLIGDIITLTRQDVLLLFTGAGITYLVFFFIWQKLLAITISEEIALAENIAVSKYKLILLTLLVLMIAFAVKIVGILLITAMLVLPVAAARIFATSPEKMLGISILIATGSVSAGIEFSYLYDSPTGPTIVFILSIIFFFLSAGRQIFVLMKKN